MLSLISLKKSYKSRAPWTHPPGSLEMTPAPTDASSCDCAPCWPFCLHSFTLVPLSLFSLSSLFLCLFPGQISLAPWGQMRRPSWLMCRVTTTRSQANRRWETKEETCKQSAATCQRVWQKNKIPANIQCLAASMRNYNRLHITIWQRLIIMSDSTAAFYSSKGGKMAEMQHRKECILTVW